jgi:hypothetical protein
MRIKEAYYKEDRNQPRLPLGQMGELGTLFCLFFIGMIIAIGIMSMFGLDDGLNRFNINAEAVAQDAFMFIMPALTFSFIVSRTPGIYLRVHGSGHSRQEWMRIVVGMIAVFIIGLPFMNFIIEWNEGLKFPDGMEQYLRNMEDAAEKISKFLLAESSISGLIVNILIIGVLAGVSEELFFRASLQRILSRKNVYLGIWLTAFFFSFMHFQFYGFIPRLLLGAFFGYLYYWTRSIWPCVIAHALNNSTAVAVAWLTTRGYVAESTGGIGDMSSGYGYLAAISLVALILFLKYARKYFFK